MSKKEKKIQKNMLFVITGGGGYTGYHIGYKLTEGGHDVRLIDISPPDQLWETTAPEALYDALPKGFWKQYGSDQVPKKGKLTFHYADITDKDALRRAFAGADGIIHAASYGVSGEEQLLPYYGKQELVNLFGTKNALEAAHLEQVRTFVFTSTVNVIFGGDPILGGDESLPYFPLHQHVDQYSRTKAMAEMLVLAFNGKQIDAHSGHVGSNSSWSSQRATPSLRTCSLRLNGIMGLGEKRHTDRIMKALQNGLVAFTFGEKTDLVDFIGIQNVVQAHIRSLMQLTAEGTNAHNFKDDNILVSGEAFFISENAPIRSYEYIRPLVDALGYSYPTANLPLQVIMVIAQFQEFIYRIIYKFYPFMPFVTPVEAFKAGRTNYFKCDKATKRFGYSPTRPNDLSQVIAFFQERKMYKKKNNLFFKIFIFVILFFWLYVLLFTVTTW